jgi:hypothetical protein
MHIHINDVEQAILDGRLHRLQDEWEFDPGAGVARYEDPVYRQADPDLPERALDPEVERRSGQMRGSNEEAQRAAASAVAGGVYKRIEEEESTVLLADPKEGTR